MKDTVTYKEDDLVEFIGTGLSGKVVALRAGQIYWVRLDREPNPYAQTIVALHTNQFRLLQQTNLL